MTLQDQHTQIRHWTDQLKYDIYSIIAMIIFLLLLFFIIPFPVDAYIDPGTGSYFFQVVIASALGVFFTVRSWLRRKKAVRGVSDDKKYQYERPRDDL